MKWSSFADTRGHHQATVFKVFTLEDFLSSTVRPERCGLLIGERDSLNVIQRASESLPWATLLSNEYTSAPDWWNGPWVGRLRRGPAVRSGDVVSIVPNGRAIRFLHRAESRSNVLFTTARCNCMCLMCSQPPLQQDDSWRLRELLDQIELIGEGVEELAITGGEPTLLGDGLVQLIAHCKRHLPKAALHILSNGRLLADGCLARAVAAIRHPDVVWGIPINAEVARVHDKIMGADGAFAETMFGIHQLLKSGQRVEIRVILQKSNTERVGELARFIFWNMPNVFHVAFMGLEPIGLARKNVAEVNVDLARFVGRMREALFYLDARGISSSLYNVPLCIVPTDLWRFCRKSISDWKNSFLATCSRCAARSDCCGFFDSISTEWVSASVAPIHVALANN